MAIITRIRNGVKYLYESIYIGNGKHKETCLGRLDENGELIPSKKKSTSDVEKDSGAVNREDNRKEVHNKIAPMFSGKLTNTLGRARTIGSKDAFGVLKINGLNIFAPDNIQQIGVGTAKIFRYAVAEFTKHNRRNALKNEIRYRVFLDVKDFATANGVDINSINAMKNFRRKLSKHLETLRTAGVSWTEKVQGKEQRYSGLNYIGKYDLKGNTLEIEFTVTIAEYLTLLPLIQYPRSLYKVDDKDFNAFAIGEAMCIHYSQDNNVIRGTEGKLTVETLLTYTSFPSYNQLKLQRSGWEKNIKEPLENALDKLTQCGFIKKWEYCYKGGIEIPDDEMRLKNFTYREFLSLVVKFEISNFSPHETRTIEIVKKKAQEEKNTSKRQTTTRSKSL